MKNAGDVFLEVVVFVELNEIHISVPVCPGQEVLVKVFGNAGVCECPVLFAEPVADTHDFLNGFAGTAVLSGFAQNTQAHPRQGCAAAAGIIGEHIAEALVHHAGDQRGFTKTGVTNNASLLQIQAGQRLA